VRLIDMLKRVAARLGGESAAAPAKPGSVG